MAQLSHGRILGFSEVVLSITLRSQYADSNGTPWEMGKSEAWCHQLSLEIFNPFDMFHQFLDRLIVFWADISGPPIEEYFLYSSFSKISAPCNIPSSNNRDELSGQVCFTYRSRSQGHPLGKASRRRGDNFSGPSRLFLWLIKHSHEICFTKERLLVLSQPNDLIRVGWWRSWEAVFRRYRYDISISSVIRNHVMDFQPPE